MHKWADGFRTSWIVGGQNGLLAESGNNAKLELFDSYSMSPKKTSAIPYRETIMLDFLGLGRLIEKFALQAKLIEPGQGMMVEIVDHVRLLQRHHRMRNQRCN